MTNGSFAKFVAGFHQRFTCRRIEPVQIFIVINRQFVITLHRGDIEGLYFTEDSGSDDDFFASLDRKSGSEKKRDNT